MVIHVGFSLDLNQQKLKKKVLCVCVNRSLIFSSVLYDIVIWLLFINSHPPWSWARDLSWDPDYLSLRLCRSGLLPLLQANLISPTVSPHRVKSHIAARLSAEVLLSYLSLAKDNSTNCSNSLTYHVFVCKGDALWDDNTKQEILTFWADKV